MKQCTSFNWTDRFTIGSTITIEKEKYTVVDKVYDNNSDKCVDLVLKSIDGEIKNFSDLYISWYLNMVFDCLNKGDKS